MTPQNSRFPGKAAESALTSENLIRPLVRQLQGYIPGEQPQINGLIKLNTNENPYPPSPYVIAAVRDAVDQRLRLYPNPTAQPLRKKLAHFHGCDAANVIVGNGSDELLALAPRAFVDLAGTPSDVSDSQSTIQFLSPSYSLYPVLAAAHGARLSVVELQPDFGLPSPAELPGLGWNFSAALTFITTPNAPSGRGYRTTDLREIAQAQKGVLVLDEAYVDFADESALALALEFPHVLVARTFSKAYSLCLQRIGYFVGHPTLIAALDKIRDSYNVNGLGQIAALATLDDLPYYRENFQKVIATRQRLTVELRLLGFDVLPSQANFLFARPPRFRAEQWLQRLRDAKILVRWFDYPRTRDYVRISIGTDDEADALLHAARTILAAP